MNVDSPSNNRYKKINKINKSKKIGKINKCKGSHFHCNNHKRDEDGTADDADTEGEGEDPSRLVKRRKNSSYKHNGYNGEHRNNYGKNNNGYKNNGQKSDNKAFKAQTEISTSGIKRTSLPGNINPGLSARHHHHHDDDHWEHEHYHDHDHEDVHVHEHIHSHEHKRDLAARHEDEHVHMHIHEDEHYHDHDSHHHHDGHHNDKRRHRDHDEWLDDMTYDRHYHDGHAHIHLHEHDHHHSKRQATQSGIPGFVEVANTLAGTTLAKSVAGLVFSKGPDPNASGFLLGTSESQSTQFYLVPTDDQSTLETSHSANASMASPEDTAKTYQLRIPVLDSKKFESNDYCATFDILPPSPMTMAPCKQTEGFSQIFNYNATTGELTPVYPATSTQPKPMNAAVRMSEPQVMAAQFPVTPNQVPVSDASAISAATGLPAPSSDGTSPSAGSSDPAASATDSSSAWPSPSADASSSSAAPASTSTPDNAAAPSDAPKVSLFFIPASTYSSPATESSPPVSESSSPAPAGSIFDPAAKGKAKIVDPSEDAGSEDTESADSDAFTPGDSQAKIVTPSDGEMAQDWTASSDNSGTVTTTVIVTSTMDASSPQATPNSSADWSSSSGASDTSAE